MAGSRFQRFGSIYDRLNGLLRSGALDASDRPIWYDVYQRYPPKVHPEFERPVPSQELRQIVYPEDIIRLNFYKIYGDIDAVDLKDESKKSNSQLFVDKYLELLQTGEDRKDLFFKTAQIIQGQGIKLKNSQDLKPIKEVKSEDTGTKIPTHFFFRNMHGDVLTEKKEKPVENVMEEDLNLE